jgi:hypothetical protein
MVSTTDPYDTPQSLGRKMEGRGTKKKKRNKGGKIKINPSCSKFNR